MKNVQKQLMEFQEFLLETLYSNNDITTIQKKLEVICNNSLFEKWLQSLNPSMLEVAARMTQHWGKKIKSF